jgi:hypothetical protein
MLFLVNKLYHVCILIFIVILFYLMLRKHLKKSKNKTIFQLKHRVKLFVNVVDDKQTDSTSENIICLSCMLNPINLIIRINVNIVIFM